MIYNINTKNQAAAGPAQAKGLAGPARARPLAWAGPAAAWYFVSILYIFVYLGYISGYILIYMWYICSYKN